jgi:hypothetical protein
MATWMACHDVVQHYDIFLRWAKGEGILDVQDEDASEAQVAKPEPKRKQCRKEANEVQLKVRGTGRGYSVAKTPGYGYVPIDTLVNKFGAADFLWYLKEFLLAHSLPIPPHNVPFGVFKHLSVTLPQIPQVSDLVNLRDVIWTTLAEPAQDRKKAVPAQFDTVLAFEKAGLSAFSDPSNPLKGVYSQFYP